MNNPDFARKNKKNTENFSKGAEETVMKRNYRTDLAVETQEILEKEEKLTGFTRKSRQLDEDISVTAITIEDEEGEKAFGKPTGTYSTM